MWRQSGSLRDSPARERRHFACEWASPMHARGVWMSNHPGRRTFFVVIGDEDVAAVAEDSEEGPVGEVVAEELAPFLEVDVLKT